MYNFIQVVSAFKKSNRKNLSEGRMFYRLSGEEKTLDKLWSQAPAWQRTDLKKSEKELLQFQSNKGPVWVLRPKAKSFGFNGAFEDSVYSWTRDTMGTLWASLRSQNMSVLQIDLGQANSELLEAVVIGLGVSHYQFKEQFEEKKITSPKVEILAKGVKDAKKVVAAAIQKADAINWARHMINLPPNICNPAGFEKMLKENLPAGLKMTVWDEKRLQKEKMNLLLGVGQGSATPPRLIHLQWRPGKTSSKETLAFVGKGITFDTGGLDIKPSSGMRLMKKDMGGSAVVAGLALWVAGMKLPVNCDFYLALAENAVDGNSFRPGDVIKSRAGFTVEIDNTDAEGRLVLADALNVALEGKPTALINVATLTGAIKVALGAEVAGLFCNNDDLSADLVDSSARKGEGVWRMPLVQKYFGSLNSPFADFKNSGEGFGGAITAALFLQKFVGKTPWAHLDIYAWTDRPSGALASSGGHAQGLQLLMDFVEKKCI